jgi:ADP-heptose:LPS heptosyltransferase
MNRLEAAGFLGEHRSVAIHPGGRVARKCWDRSAFARLADTLTEQYDARVCITGGERERAEAKRLIAQMKGHALNLCGNLNVRELQVLYGRMDLVVTNDTAALHVASGANAPTVAIFGPSEPWETGPRSDACRVVMKEAACRSGCDFTCTHEREGACLRDLAPEEVLAACAEMLDEKKRFDALPSRVGKDEEKVWTTSTGCSG